MTATVLTAGDATSAASGIQGGNDGTLVLVVGPNGGKLNAVSFDAAGVPTYIKQPIFPAQSMVRLNTANGYGTTNTAIRRFTNIVTNQGTDITYSDSATLGGTFTINTNGIYAITYFDQQTNTADIGISLNSSQLTTIISGINAADRLIEGTAGAAGQPANCSITVYLLSGSIIRAHGDAGSSSGTRQSFTITRVA